MEKLRVVGGQAAESIGDRRAGASARSRRRGRRSLGGDARSAGLRQGQRVPASPEHFYSEAHRRIHEACVELSAEGKPVDVVQVATWLRDRERLAQVGGMAYLTEVLNAAPAVANVVAYAQDDPREVARPAAHPRLPARHRAGLRGLRRGAAVHRLGRAGRLRHRPHPRVDERLPAPRRHAGDLPAHDEGDRARARASSASRPASIATTG